MLLPSRAAIATVSGLTPQPVAVSRFIQLTTSSGARLKPDNLTKALRPDGARWSARCPSGLSCASQQPGDGHDLAPTTPLSFVVATTASGRRRPPLARRLDAAHEARRKFVPRSHCSYPDICPGSVPEALG